MAVAEHQIDRAAIGGRAEEAWAYRRLLQAAGNLPIRALAEQIGWSERHLQRRFRDQVGLAPSTLAPLGPVAEGAPDAGAGLARGQITSALLVANPAE